MSLLQRYRDMSAPVKASVWYAICDIVQKGILVLTIPIFTRIMTTAEYGLTNVYSSWMAIIVIFATLNLQHGTFNTAMVEFEDDRDRFISSVQGLITTSVMILFLVYLPLSGIVDGITKLNLPLFAAMAIQMLTTASFGFWSGKKRFDYLYKKVVILTVASAVLTTVVSIFLVMSADEGRGEIKVISTVLMQAILFIPVYLTNAVKGRSFFVKKYWKFALGMNIPLIPYYLAQAVFNNADLLMIEWFCGMSDAALYGTVYSFATLMILVINAINNSFVPWKYRKMKGNNLDEYGDKWHCGADCGLVGPCHPARPRDSSPSRCSRVFRRSLGISARCREHVLLVLCPAIHRCRIPAEKSHDVGRGIGMRGHIQRCAQCLDDSRVWVYCSGVHDSLQLHLVRRVQLLCRR